MHRRHSHHYCRYSSHHEFDRRFAICLVAIRVPALRDDATSGAEAVRLCLQPFSTLSVLRNQMSFDDLARLSTLIREKRDDLLCAWRTQAQELAGAHGISSPTLDDHIPDLLDDLATALTVSDNRPISEQLMKDSPPAHGLQRLRDGFDIVEVVAEYNMVRRAVHDFAAHHGVNLGRDAAHIVNRVLDEAIGLAVKTFAVQQAVELQRRREEHLAFVAHDLKTPLVAISLMASEIKEALEPEPNEIVKDMFETLERNVERLDNLVTKVVQEKTVLDRIESLSPERRWFDLRPLVQKLVRDMRPIFTESQIQVTNAIPKKLAIFADAHMVNQIFQNLLTNAAKYTQGGAIVVLAEEHNGAIECAVKDTGEGIPPGRIERVFDKLETDPDPERQGMGLGLAIVKQAVEAHNGTVAVESSSEVGTTFRFTIPLSE